MSSTSCPRPTRTTRRHLSALAACVFVLAACGSGDAEVADETTASTVAEVETATETSAPEPEPEPVETTAAPETTTTEAPEEESTTTTAPDLGGPSDFGPAAGQPLAVINVRYDDELNFRAGPGTGEAIVRRVDALDDTVIIAAGEAWSFERSVWWKVTIDGEEMWANQSFLGMLGSTSSIFDLVADRLDTLEYETLQDLVEAIADGLAIEEPAPTFEYASEPLAFDTGDAFVIVDFDGFLDDAVRGERLRIEAEVILGDDADVVGVPVGVRLTEVLSTGFCSRGVTEGLCL